MVHGENREEAIASVLQLIEKHIEIYYDHGGCHYIEGQYKAAQAIIDAGYRKLEEFDPTKTIYPPDMFTKEEQ